MEEMLPSSSRMRIEPIIPDGVSLSTMRINSSRISLSGAPDATIFAIRSCAFASASRSSWARVAIESWPLQKAYRAPGLPGDGKSPGGERPNDRVGEECGIEGLCHEPVEAGGQNPIAAGIVGVPADGDRGKGGALQTSERMKQ